VTEVGLSLGSNLGDRLAHLQAARDRLMALPQTRLLAQAPVYETEPVDVAESFRDLAFLNTVVIVETGLPVTELAAAAHAIEDWLGRRRGGDRNAPRPIDIDLIYAGDETCHAAALSLPHPRWLARRFVVQPLADVRPVLRLPNAPGTVAEVLLTLPPTPNVVLYRETW